MKQLLLLGTVILTSFSAYAQPTVTGMENFAAGDQFNLVNCRDTLLSPGSSGASQTWSFTSLHPIDTTTTYVMAASAAPDKAKWPAANLAYYNRPGLWTYVAKNGVHSSIIGIMDSNAISAGTAPSGSRWYGYDSALFAGRPITYSNVLANDFVSSTTTSFGPSFPSKGGGMMKVTVDGWGTLRLPGATYANVIRVKQEMYQKDSNITLTKNYVIVTHTNYLWYSAAAKNPLLAITTFSIADSNRLGLQPAQIRKTLSYYLDPNPPANVSVVGIQQEPAPLSGIWSSMGGLLLHAGFANGGQYYVTITNMSGVRQFAAELTAHHGAIAAVLGKDLPPGLYMVYVADVHSKQVFKTLKIVKE